MKSIEIISQDVFDKVRSRFQNMEMGDKTGAVTIDPTQARFFDFDFVNEGVNLGRVSISLNDAGSLKIYYSQGITENQDDFSKKLWYSFLREMRLFAMRRLLRFDTRDIAKTNLDKNDFQHLAKTQAPKKEEDMTTMNESRWNHKSSKKTSRAVRGQTEVIVRHAKPVDTDYAGSRSQRKNIKAIFVQNRDGERFKYPFVHTAGAFAMAQHVDHGGVPHDPAGKAIIGMSEEMAKLAEFKNKVRSASLHDDAHHITERAIGRLNELRAQIEALGKRHHYEAWMENFQEPMDDGLEMDEVAMEEYKQKFTQTSFQEELAGYFPLLHRIMKETNKLDLEEYVKENTGDEKNDIYQTDWIEIVRKEVEAGGDLDTELDRLAYHLEFELGADEDDVRNIISQIDLNLRDEHPWDDDVDEAQDSDEDDYFYSVRHQDARSKETEMPPKGWTQVSQHATGAEATSALNALKAKHPGEQFTTTRHPRISNMGGVPKRIFPEGAAKGPEAQFEMWAEAVEQKQLTPNQIDLLKKEIDIRKNSGKPLQLGPNGKTAWDFFSNAINPSDSETSQGPEFSDELKKEFEKFADHPEMDAMEIFTDWTQKNYPELAVALGLSGTEAPAEQPAPAQSQEQPVAEAPEDRDSYKVAKILFDRGVRYTSGKGDEIVDMIPGALREMGFSRKTIQTYMGYDEDFISDTIGELIDLEKSQGMDENEEAGGFPNKPMEEDNVRTEMIKMVAEKVKTFHNKSNEDLAPFRAEENIATETKKEVKEKFGGDDEKLGEELGEQAREMALAFMEKKNTEWQQKNGIKPQHNELERLKELLGNVKEKVESIGDVGGHPGKNIMPAEEGTFKDADAGTKQPLKVPREKSPLSHDVHQQKNKTSSDNTVVKGIKKAWDWITDPKESVESLESANPKAVDAMVKFLTSAIQGWEETANEPDAGPDDVRYTIDVPAMKEHLQKLSSGNATEKDLVNALLGYETEFRETIIESLQSANPKLYAYIDKLSEKFGWGSPSGNTELEDIRRLSGLAK